jgi:hypothetical protein
MKTLYSITDCAKLLGIQEHRIAYAHRTGKLPEPKMRFAGKRVYSAADLRRVAAYFGGSDAGKGRRMNDECGILRHFQEPLDGVI